MGKCTFHCLTCEDCVSCDKYEDGVSLCDTAQYVKQYFSRFKFGDTCLQTDTDFISATSWNNLLSYISRVYALGSAQSGGIPDLPSPVQIGDEMEADMYNKVVIALNGLGSTSTLRNNMQPDTDDIYGTYFSGIESYINNDWKLNKNQCNNCNTSCITCQVCNRCQACYMCNERCDSGECDNED